MKGREGKEGRRRYEGKRKKLTDRQDREIRKTQRPKDRR
jgi:hypothetical protein